MTKEVWQEIITYGAYSEELDWYAIDRNGNLAIFSAIMGAPIPEATKRSFNNYNELQEIIYSLPKTTSSILTAVEQGNFSNWIAYAEKGLFAFDFQDVHRIVAKGQYDLVAKPTSPLRLKDIQMPSKLLDTLAQLDCVFADGDVKTELIK